MVPVSQPRFQATPWFYLAAVEVESLAPLLGHTPEMVGLVFVMMAHIICGQYRPVQRSSLSRHFANSYGVQVSNNLCVDIHVCGRHCVRKKPGSGLGARLLVSHPILTTTTKLLSQSYTQPLSVRNGLVNTRRIHSPKVGPISTPKRLTLTDSPCQRRPVSGGPPCMTSLCHCKRSLGPVSSCDTTVERLSQKLVRL